MLKQGSRLGKAFPPTVQPTTIPASVGGINALDSLVTMPDVDCLWVYNTVPSEYGLRLRKGYREWAIGVNGDVRTLVPYDSQSGSTGADRLFAVTENGIYNVTNFNSTPTEEVAFPSQAPEAGYGSYTNFTTDAPDNLVLYADEANGLYFYNGDSLTWGRPGDGTFPEITFPDATTIDDIAVIMAHKQRLWLIKSGAADAYYLPVDAIGGAAVKFNFGSKFNNGGTLRGLWSWTIDGGDGVDDFMIALSGGGDVLVYYGPDPSSPEWSLRGSYFIGQPPQARRISAEYGGDLYILSSYGIISIRDLLNGVDFSNVKVGPSAKVSRFLRTAVQEDAASWQWALHVHPRDGFMQIVTPLKNEATGDTQHRQYVQNLLTQAWGWWRDVPMICAANQTGEYYIGSSDGRVFIYDGTLDGTKLDGTIGRPINFGGLTSFQAYGNHAQNIRPSYIRTTGITGGTISLNVKGVFNYQIADVDSIAQPPPQASGQSSVWDFDKWEEAFWDFAVTGTGLPIGGSGMGRTMAIGFKGSSQTRVTITSWDVLFTAGGLM